jgi:phage tail-like protein
MYRIILLVPALVLALPQRGDAQEILLPRLYIQELGIHGPPGHERSGVVTVAADPEAAAAPGRPGQGGGRLVLDVPAGTLQRALAALYHERAATEGWLQVKDADGQRSRVPLANVRVTRFNPGAGGSARVVVEHGTPRPARADPTVTLPAGHSAGLQVDGVSIRQIQEVSGVRSGELVLTRAVTDGDPAPLRTWATRLGPPGSNARARDIILVVYDPAGRTVRRYRLLGAWPKSLEIGSMKAGDTSPVAVESLTLAHEAIEPIR